MSHSSYNPGLHRFAVLTAAATLVLLGAGGLVTSHGVGMSVPDWPNTYGYNMFFFPISKWIGGIFYEHTHRLVASGVGMLTGVLALWLYGRKARRFMRWTGLVLLALGIGNVVFWSKLWQNGLVTGVTGMALFGASYAWPRCEPSALWLRRLGLVAFVAVVLQGVLGGLRVVLLEAQIGIFHATLAQLFFALVCAIALFTSRWWQSLPDSWFSAGSDSRRRAEPGTTSARGSIGRDGFALRGLFIATTALILFQLILGATMRHQHAGLAIPDFPLAYGRLWPATDPASVAHYNERRMEITAVNPITAFQIDLQMVHRIVALLILLSVAYCAWRVWSRFDREKPALPGSGGPAVQKVLRRVSFAWLGLILVQVALGAFTIWSNKAADVATAHVLGGALSLATGVILCIISFRSPEFARSAPILSRAPAASPEGNLLPNHVSAAQHS